MRSVKKILAIAAAVITLAVMTVVANAADFVVPVGGSVTVSLSEYGKGSIDGTVTLNGNAAVTYSCSEAGGVSQNGVFYLFSSGTKTVSATIKAPSDAVVGTEYTVLFRYSLYDENGDEAGTKEVSKTVAVGEVSFSGAPGIDYTELQEQIEIASALDSGIFSGSSWDGLQKSLDAAVEALMSKSQSDVDKAASDLTEAISSLVVVDRTRLQEAIEKAYTLDKKSAAGAQWYQLFDAVEAGNDALSAGSQEEMDQAADVINDCIDRIISGGGKGNKAIFGLISLPLLISLAANLALIVLLVLYFIRKGKNRHDTTPLVDYDISDDEEDTDIDFAVEPIELPDDEE